MHPSELKNEALTAAVAAELEGFHHTAEALRVLALSFVRPNEDRWQLVNEPKVEPWKRSRFGKLSVTEMT